MLTWKVIHLRHNELEEYLKVHSLLNLVAVSSSGVTICSISEKTVGSNPKLERWDQSWCAG